MPAKKKSSKAQVKVKDMRAKKNPKGGTINFAKSATVDMRKAGGTDSRGIIAI